MDDNLDWMGIWNSQGIGFNFEVAVENTHFDEAVGLNHNFLHANHSSFPSFSSTWSTPITPNLNNSELPSPAASIASKGYHERIETSSYFLQAPLGITAQLSTPPSTNYSYYPGLAAPYQEPEFPYHPLPGYPTTSVDASPLEDSNLAFQVSTSSVPGGHMQFWCRYFHMSLSPDMSMQLELDRRHILSRVRPLLWLEIGRCGDMAEKSYGPSGAADFVTISSPFRTI